MKRTALLFSFIAAALLARADYGTLPVEADEAMGDYIRFESRSWAAELDGVGGRLPANATWNGGEYIILNDLYVPSGVTLTIGPGTKIRFCEGTRIKVEDGGQIVLNGENGNEVVLTGYDDDTDFDGITLQSGSAGYSDNDFVVAEGFAFGKFATVSLGDATAFVAGGQAIVPVTVSGSRDRAFSFDWVAETNGVAFASGTMNWSRVGDGSKNIAVPFDGAFAALESFTVRASLLRCCTARKAVSVVTLSEFITSDIQTDEAMGDFIRFESRDWTTNFTDMANVEGGRLTENTVWSGEHVIVGNVYIPSGVTLTLTADTVVRFCEGTMIKIEDGGTLRIVGADGHDVVLCGYDDETEYAGVVRMSSGTLTDNSYVRVDGPSFGNLAKVALNDSDIFRTSGLALIPVTVSGSRDSPFSIDWVAETNGVPYKTGTVRWNRVGDGTKNIAINYGAELDGLSEFTVRVAVHRACFANPGNCRVTIRDFDVSDIQIDEAMGDFIRFESRDWTTNFIEVANVEGGRLTENTVWSGEHVIMNDVYIPSGVTLTITADALVRLCEGTMIKIEDGGMLKIVGADGHDVVIRNFDDDTTSRGIVKMPSGNYSDNMYVQYPDFRYGSYPNVTLHDAAVGRDAGKVYVPLTLGGLSRDQSFNVDWKTDKGASGTVTWSRSGDGTKWIELPVDAAAIGGTETYDIRLTAGRGANLAVAEAKVTIYEFDHPVTETVVLSENAEPSPDFSVHGDIRTQPVFLNETEELRYSGHWQSACAPNDVVSRISVESDNGIARLGEWPGSEEGSIPLNLADYNVGRYTLRHEIVQKGTDNVLNTLTKTFSVVDRDDVELHGGTLTGNEVWKAEKIHVVYETVVVPGIYTLFIEPGAIVKFMTGTGIDISQGGALFANAIVFTHINDDTVGGDTLSDGYTVAPPMNAYFLSGNFTFGDDAELRNVTQKTALTGTLNGTKMLSKGSTYRVSGTFTIANGATLTIPAGTVLKMEQGAQIVVNAGGTLKANGTRAAPVVFTSINDDSYSGKTEGSNSNPQPGDWKKITVSGRAELDHVRLYYASRGSGTDDAILVYNGGSVVFSNSEMAFGQMYAIGVESGGHFYATNSVIREYYCAFRHWPNDEFVNCVFYNCDRLANNNGQRLRNCIVVGVTEAWDWSSGNGVSYNNCVLWNEPGFGLQTPPGNFIGKNGNIWGNPLFVDPANGDFRISEGSPCVDAADSSAAPELDYFGQPRITFTGRTNDTELAEGPLADIGICEVMPRDVTSDIDLVPEAVRTEETATPGQLLFVKWEVRNRGGAPVDATWRDTVSLVSQDGREVVLGDKTTKSAIAVGGSVFCSGYFTVPAMAEGTWYPKVNVNSYHDIFEGSLTVNNALVGTGGVEVTIRETESEGEEGVVNAGAPTVKRITLPETGGNRMVRIKVPAGVTIRWGFGFVPTGNQKSGTITSNGQDAIFRVPDGVTDVYVSMESDDGAEYDLSLEEGQVVITGVSPNTLPSSGEVTITIDGAGFTEDSKVYLVNGAVEIAPKLVQYVSAQELVATIDCGKLTAGTQYDVSVIGDENTATFTFALSTANIPGEWKINTRLIAPTSLRIGREATARIEYTNVGNIDAPLPIYRIGSYDNMSVQYRLDNEEPWSKVLRIVGLGDVNRACVSPGTTYSVTFYLQATRFETGAIQLGRIDDATICNFLKTVKISRFVNGEYSKLKWIVEGLTNDAVIVAGRITNAGGEGCKPYQLRFVGEDGVSRCVSTDSNGCFCSLIDKGKYYVGVDGYSVLNDPGWVEIDDSVNTFSIVVNPGCNLALKLKGFDYCCNDNYFVMATGPHGEEISRSFNADGDIPLGRVATGNWQLTLMDASSNVVHTTSVVLSDDAVIALSPPEVKAVKFSVKDEYGNVIPDVEIKVQGECKGKTDDAGVFESKFLVHSLTDICVHKDGYVDSFTNCVETDCFVTLVSGLKVMGVVSNVNPGDVPLIAIASKNSDRWYFADCNDSNVWSAFLPVGVYTVYVGDADSYDIVVSSDKVNCFVSNKSEKILNEVSSISVGNALKTSNDELSTTESILIWLRRAMIWPTARSMLGNYIGPVGSNTGYTPKHSSKGNCWVVRQNADTDWTIQSERPYSDCREQIVSIVKDRAKAKVLHLHDSIPTNIKLNYNVNPNYTEKTWAMYLDGICLAFGGLGKGTIFIDAIARSKAYEDECKTVWNYSVRLTFKSPDTYNFNANQCVVGKYPHRLEMAGWASEFYSRLDIIDDIEFSVEETKKDKDVKDEGIYRFSMPTSIDPNEMSGPLGLGDSETERYVKPGEWMTYTVYFENRADATAAAQEVRVTNPLSPYLDWSTFEMGEVAFNNQIDLGLSGKRNGTSEAVMKGTNTLVRTQLTLNEKTGIAEWYLRIVDPTTATGWPEDVFAGFLPPNDETFRGEGHLTYRVKVRDDAPHGVRIDNSASIVFDYNEPIETDPSWWNTVARTLEAGFVEPEVMVDEGGTATIAVRGGSAERETSVQVSLAYQTASAADLDLKNAKVDGATPKGGLRFPLTLSWAAGEIGAKTITIPVKADRAVENEELFTLQLANAQGMGVGDASCCTVTIRDANAAADYAAKQGKTTVRTKKGVPDCALSIACVAMDGSGEPCGFTTGQGSYYTGCKASLKATARPGWAFAGWGEVEDGVTNVVSDKASWSVAVTDDADIIAFFDRIPYVRGLAHLADRGKVTGGGYCPAGKKVTLRATANRGYVFEGWYGAKGGNAGEIDPSGQPVAKTPALIVDRTVRPAKSDARQTVITEVDGSVTYFAKFITNQEDIEAVSLDLDGVPLSAEDAFATNLICGVAVDWPVVSGGLSATTVRASGLPAGLKLVQDRATRAYSVVGVPTTASKIDKSGNVKPSVAKFTVTTAGRNARTFVVEIAVSPLPTWAVGSFDGAVQMGDIVGAASMTVAANGRVSGKYGLCGTNWTFSASGYTEFIDDDIETNRLFALDVMAKSGRMLRDLRIEVTPGWMADIVAYRFPDAWIMEEDARAYAESLGMSWPYDPPLECVTQEVSRINCSQANGADVADAALLLHRGIWKDYSAKSRKPMVDGLFDWWPVLEPWRNWVFDAENFPDVKMSVATSGRVSFAGKLPDGVRASSSTTAYLVPESGHPRALFIVPTTKNAAGLLDEVVCPHDDL